MRTAMLCLLLGAAAGCGTVPTSAPAVPVWGNGQGVHPKDDPWPECAAVRAYLVKTTNDPATLEVVEWTGKPSQIVGDRISVSVRIREKNKFGAIQNQRLTCYVHKDAVQDAYDETGARR